MKLESRIRVLEVSDSGNQLPAEFLTWGEPNRIERAAGIQLIVDWRPYENPNLPIDPTNGKEWVRGPTESEDEFKARVISEAPPPKAGQHMRSFLAFYRQAVS